MLPLVNFTLYETKTRYYIAGSDITCTDYRIAKIDKTADSQLSFTDDKVTYTEKEITDLLWMISHGNKSTGGLRKKLDFDGIFGFVRFVECYYLILITKKSPVALIGGHYINHIDDTVMIPIHFNSKTYAPSPQEQRYFQIFNQVDRTKNFYFSYTYDLTRSLQSNMTQGWEKITPKTMFLWNEFLTSDVFDDYSMWYIPIIHGFVDQASMIDFKSEISVFGHNILITLIARRSKYFAGARFLKRGVSDKGYVANDVETEQIVHDASRTLFSCPKKNSLNNTAYTSFLQHRGSIPLFWSQDISPMAAKPQIEMDLRDPFYTATAKHFNDLFIRYGSPIIVLNLVKTKERVKRESILLEEFTAAIQYLNQSLSEDKKIKYIAWDMARASKSSDQDVIGTLEKIARECIELTGFFHSGEEPYSNAIRRANLNGQIDVEHENKIKLQQGILRTNCIDCLDRTNAAQFVVGKCALGRQLYALGVIPSPAVPFDSDTINIFNAMYHDHGDTIALQYGGSHLVNTMETYRKMSAWTSHSRDMIESIRRYYSNSFTDAEKQNAINLFLGNFIPKNNQNDLWDVADDFYLHNALPTQKTFPKRYRTILKSYSVWFDSGNLKKNDLSKELTKDVVNYNIKKDKDLLMIYYNPKGYTTLDKLFSYRMMSTNPNTSSFVARPNPAASSLVIYNLNIGGVRRWLRPATVEPEQAPPLTKPVLMKQETPTNWNSGTIGERLLIPAVNNEESLEYERYINQFKYVDIGTVLVSHDDKDIIDHEQVISHPDYLFFKQNINLTNGTNISPIVEAVDESAYDAYIASSTIDNYVGLGTRSKDINRIEKYKIWLETGVFSVKANKKKDLGTKKFN